MNESSAPRTPATCCATGKVRRSLGVVRRRSSTLASTPPTQAALPAFGSRAREAVAGALCVLAVASARGRPLLRKMADDITVSSS